MNTRTKFTALFFVAATVLFSSCQKTEVEPLAPTNKIEKPNLVQDADSEASRPPCSPILK